MDGDRLLDLEQDALNEDEHLLGQIASVGFVRGHEVVPLSSEPRRRLLAAARRERRLTRTDAERRCEQTFLMSSDELRCEYEAGRLPPEELDDEEARVLAYVRSCIWDDA